jgi:two-component system response regulator GlrR
MPTDPTGYARELTGPEAEPASLPPFKQAKSAFEISYVTQAMRLARGNVARAARLAGKERKDFYDLMRRHRLHPDDFR